MENFNQHLADIYKSIHPISAKNKFVTYLNHYEKALLCKNDLQTLKICVNKLKKLLDWKSRQIMNIVEKADLPRIALFIEEIKKDNKTLLIIKTAICKEILKRLEQHLTTEQQQTNETYLNYKKYVHKIAWIFNSEHRIIKYVTGSLQKAATSPQKLTTLRKIRPVILTQIKSRELTAYAAAILTPWEQYYQAQLARDTQLATDNQPPENREQPPQTTAEHPPGISIQVDSPAETDIHGHLDEYQDIFDGDPEAEPVSFPEEGSLNLPDFEEDEETFLNRLSQMENAGEMVSEIDTLPQLRQEQVITRVSFDPRFDNVYAEILAIKGDMGQLLGLLTREIKEVEKLHGFQASEAFLQDLIARIEQDKGPDNLAVKKIRNFLGNLTASHQRSTRMLQQLKTGLKGKGILDQVKVLQDTAKNREFKGIFGTVRNLERLALENHFDEIFDSLPVEIQKIVGDAFLYDLKELKLYYPQLLTKLQNRVEEATLQLQQSYSDSYPVDPVLLDRILEFTGTIDPGGISELVTITNGILADQKNNTGYKDLGILMAGNGQHTPGQLLSSLEQQDNRESTMIREVIRIMHEIEELGSLNEKISTIRFRIENRYYGDDPYILNFLQGQLEALERTRVQEGGMLRRLFDQMEQWSSFEKKIAYLKNMLDDAAYYHLKPIIKNLINNLAIESSRAKGLISTAFIRGELEKCAHYTDQLNWLKARLFLPVFAPFTAFMEAKIKEIEEQESAATIEKMVDDLTGKQAADSARQKQAQGIEIPLHTDIISLAKAVLKIDDKLTRRKFIKTQEIVHPLADEHKFQQQRKLLFILMNVNPGSEPVAMVKALAGKILLSPDEKKRLFTVLKLAQKGNGDSAETLLQVLGIGEEELAYHAADILAFTKTSAADKLRFFEDMRNGKIKTGTITYTGPNGEQTTTPYTEFFGIKFHIINKLIIFYKKQVKTGQATPPPATDDTPPAESGESVMVEVTGGQTVTASLPEELPGELPDSLDESDPESGQEPLAGELAESFPGDLSGDNPAAEDSQVEDTTNEISRPLIPEEIPEEQPEDDIKKQQAFTEESTATSRPQPVKMPAGAAETSETAANPITADISKPDTNAQKLYLKNQARFDDFAKKRIEEMASRYREVEDSIKEKVLTAHQEYKKQTENKLQSILRNLNSCQPEMISELINKTILPLLSEIGDQATQDLISTLNQNLFAPILYTGARMDVKTVIHDIETFLHRDGVFQNSFNELTEITDKLHGIRQKYINAEVQGELEQITALNRAVKSGSIDHIFTNLLNVEPPARILTELQKGYLTVLADKPQHRNLVSRLELAKDLIAAEKAINWGDGETFSDSTRKLILKLREKFKQATAQAMAGSQAAGSQDNKKFGPAEKVLVNAGEFINPTQVLKQTAKTENITLSSGEQQELITRLFDEGKIFSYDKKHYIGSGKLFHYLNDKNNIGYSRNKLASELIPFLERFASRKLKAGFIGIPADQLDEFLKKLHYWSSHSDSATTGPKQHRPPVRLPPKTRKPAESVNQVGKKTQTTAHNRKPAAVKSAKQTVKKPTAEKRDLLKRLNKMITDKLLFLIKESASRSMLNMLYKSYLDPKAKQSDLFVLLDKTKFQKLYEAIKADETLHSRLSFDRDTVQRALEKKLKKVKK